VDDGRKAAEVLANLDISSVAATRPPAWSPSSAPPSASSSESCPTTKRSMSSTEDAAEVLANLDISSVAATCYASYV
jgi:hypothetical protein